MSTVPSRPAYHHGDLPRALVDASLTLVGTHGVEGFSLRAAAREAGVHPAAVYRHFRDRSQLLGAVAAVGFEQLADRMYASIAGETGPDARFLVAGETYVRFALDNPQYFRVMFGPYGSGPEGAARRRGTATGGSSPYALLVELLTRLAETGRISGRIEAATLTAWSTLHGLAALLVDRAVVLTDPELDDAIAHLTRSVLRGLHA